MATSSRTRPRPSHPVGPSLLTNTVPPLGINGSPASIRRPLIDPYKSFSSDDFDGFVDGLTSKIRRVLSGFGDEVEDEQSRRPRREEIEGAGAPTKEEVEREEDVFGAVEEVQPVAGPSGTTGGEDIDARAGESASGEPSSGSVSPPRDSVPDSGLVDGYGEEDEEGPLEPFQVAAKSSKPPPDVIALSDSSADDDDQELNTSFPPHPSAEQLAYERKIRRVGSSSADGRLLFRGSVTSEDGQGEEDELDDEGPAERRVRRVWEGVEEVEGEEDDGDGESEEELEEVQVGGEESAMGAQLAERRRKELSFLDDDEGSSSPAPEEPVSRSRSASLSAARDRGYSGDSDDLRLQDQRAALEASRSLGEQYEEYEEDLIDDDDVLVVEEDPALRGTPGGLGSHATPIEIGDSDEEEASGEDDNDLFEQDRDVLAQRDIESYLSTRRPDPDDADHPSSSAYAVDPILDDFSAGGPLATSAGPNSTDSWSFGARHPEFIKRVEDEAAARESGEPDHADPGEIKAMDEVLLRQLLETVSTATPAPAGVTAQEQAGGGEGGAQMPRFEDFLASPPLAWSASTAGPAFTTSAPIPPQPPKPQRLREEDQEGIVEEEEDEEEAQAPEQSEGYTRPAAEKGKGREAAAAIWGELADDEAETGDSFGAFESVSGGLMRNRSPTPTDGVAAPAPDGAATGVRGEEEESDEVHLLDTGSENNEASEDAIEVDTDEEEFRGIVGSIAESFEGATEDGHIRVGADHAIVEDGTEGQPSVISEQEELGMESSRAASSEPFQHFSPFSQPDATEEEKVPQEKGAAEDVEMADAFGSGKASHSLTIHDVTQPGEYDRSMPIVFGESPRKGVASASGSGLKEREDIFAAPRKAGSTQGVTFADLPESSRQASPRPGMSERATDGGSSRSGDIAMPEPRSPSTSQGQVSQASETSDRVTSRDPASFPASSAPSSYVGSRSPSPAPSMAPPPPLQSAAMGAPDAAVGYAHRSSRRGSVDSSVNVEPPSPSVSARQSGAPISNEQINTPGLPHIAEALEGTPPANDLPDPRKPPPPTHTDAPRLSDIPQVAAPPSSQASSVVAQPPSPPRSAAGPVEEQTLAVDVNQPGLPHAPADPLIATVPVAPGTVDELSSLQASVPVTPALSVFEVAIGSAAPPPLEAPMPPYPLNLLAKPLTRTGSTTSSLAVLPPSPRLSAKELKSPESATPLAHPLSAEVGMPTMPLRNDSFDPSSLSAFLAPVGRRADGDKAAVAETSDELGSDKDSDVVEGMLLKVPAEVEKSESDDVPSDAAPPTGVADEDSPDVVHSAISAQSPSHDEGSKRPSQAPRRSSRLQAREPTAGPESTLEQEIAGKSSPSKHTRSQSMVGMAKIEEEKGSPLPQHEAVRPETLAPVEPVHQPTPARSEAPTETHKTPPRRRLHQHGAAVPKSGGPRASMPRRASNPTQPASSPPVTRSHCSFKRLDFPAGLDGASPLQRFLVPQCSIAGKSDFLEEYRIVDAGDATAEDQVAAKRVSHEGVIADSKDRISARTCNVLARLVGIDLLHEGQVEIIPMRPEEQEAQILAEVEAATDEAVESGLNQAMEDSLPSPPKGRREVKNDGSPPTKTALEDRKRKRDDPADAVPPVEGLPAKRRGWLGGLFGR